MNISKYYWNLSDKALAKTAKILKNYRHPLFPERMITLLSRCDEPKEVFSVVPKEKFIEAWPKVNTQWAKTGEAPQFKNWWNSIYEQLLKDYGIERKKADTGAPSFLLSKIGKTIKKARLERGLSQKGLALKTGMKQPDISMIEQGKKNITIETLAVLSKALGIKKLELV